MKSSKQVLSSLLKTTQMGQIGIRSVLSSPMKPQLRGAMESQLEEYDQIETQAHQIARKRGWELRELNPSIRFMTEQMSKAKLSFGDVNSKIAAMMIRGNTTGIIKSLQSLHALAPEDEEVAALSRKLSDTESSNVQQMKAFL